MHWQRLNVIEQAGGDVSHLRQQTERLENTWHSLSTDEQTRQLNELAKQTNGLATNTNRATQQMERFLGVRSNNTITAEITQVNTALATLRQRLAAGTISQQEFNRMNAAGEIQLNALQAELNQTSADLQRAGNASTKASSGIDQLKNKLMGMAGAYVGVQTVTAGIRELVETSKQMDSLNQKLEYATGSAKQAGETWAYLKDIANELGLEQMGLAEGYAQLASATKNLNMSTDDTRTAFEGVANASAAMSLTTDETNGVMLALSQIAGKGKVSMEELRGQLGERLTPAMGIAAQAMGVTTQELEKMVEQGIDAKEFLPKFGQALSESFGQQAQNNIQTTTGAINLLSNKLTELKAKVLDSFASDAIASSTQFFSDTLDKISHAMDEIDLASIEAVKAVFTHLFSVIGTISQTLGGLYSDFNNLFTAMTGFDEASEKVGFFTRTLQGLSIVIAGIDDVFKGLQATANFAIGGVLSAVSSLYDAMSRLDILPDALQAKYQNMSDDLRKASDEAFARFDKNVDEFESSTKKALDATIITAEQMAEKADKSAQQAINSFTKLAKDATASCEQLAQAFGEAVSKATDPKQVEQLIDKFGELQVQGKITGEQLAQGVNIATPKIIELENALKDTGKSASDMANEATDAAEDIKIKMADTANSLGLDFDKASNRVSASFSKISVSVMDVAEHFDELKKQGYDASALVMQGLEKLGEKVNNKADLDALITLWQQFGKDGQLSSEQVELGIDSINEKLQKSPHLLDETAKALKALGIISKQEATRQAQEQIQNFEIAKQAFNKGLVSAEQLQQAIGKVQKSVQVSGNASQQAWLKSQQAALGLTQTLKTTQHAIENTAQSSRQIGTNMEQSANRGVKALDKLNQKLSETVTWNEKVAASASANQAKRQTKNNDFLAAVGRQHSQYSTLTGMENFLKSAGLSQEKAFEEARKLMESHGKNGRMNWASAMGHTEGMPITSMKSPSVYLLELAEKIRMQEAEQKRRDEFLKPKKNHAEQSHSSELDRLKRENEQLKLKHEKTKHALHSKRMENLSGGSAPSLQEIIQALDARTIQSIKQHAKTELLNELITEVKRMPR